ncbi:hypothetical protein KCU93_g135, partial [Aureobasidium melanogenum]
MEFQASVNSSVRCMSGAWQVPYHRTVLCVWMAWRVRLSGLHPTNCTTRLMLLDSIPHAVGMTLTLESERMF